MVCTFVAKAIIPLNMLDLECVDATIKEMGIAYKIDNGTYRLANNLSLTMTPTGVSVTYNESNIDANRFIDKFIGIYKIKQEEKVKKLRLEQARLQEEAILNQYSEEELKKERAKIRRNELALEDIKRKEIELQKKKITDTITSLKEKAKKMGYNVREENQGQEKVLILIKN